MRETQGRMAHPEPRGTYPSRNAQPGPFARFPFESNEGYRAERRKHSMHDGIESRISVKVEVPDRA